MKFLASLLVFGFLSTTFVNSFPANSKSNPDDETEFVIVPLEKNANRYGNGYPSSFDIVDTDDFPPPHLGPYPGFFPSVNPLTWQLRGFFDDVFRRLHDRVSTGWNNVPSFGIPSFIPRPGLWPTDIDVDGDSEDGKKNSTSTTKIIDGHKVTINDTYFTKNDEFGTSLFKVRVIDVKPVDDDSEKTPAADGDKDAEPDLRNGADDKDNKSTEKPRDTELDESDEEDQEKDKKEADDKENAIDNDEEPTKKAEDGEVNNKKEETDDDDDTVDASTPADLP
uniref:Putative secreted mucin n=1 Tax=Corethrella appendiculata TaxID=1370023 RepID=U5ENV0_9DIPT